jgi:membrane protease YdiL (CAAX protease family)
MFATPRTPLGDSALLASLTFVAAAIAAVGAAVLVAVAAAVVAVLQGSSSPEAITSSVTSYWATVATIVASQAAMLCVALAAWWCTGGTFRRRLSLTAPRVTLMEGATILAACGVPMAIALFAAATLPSFTDPTQIMSIWSDTPPLLAVLWIAIIGLLPGITEEILLRGLIQRGFCRRLGPVIAILVTSVLFAFLHVDPAAMGLAFILGLWLGVVAWRTGSIILPILTHILVNSSWNTIQIVGLQAPLNATLGTILLVVVGVVTTTAFVYSIGILRRVGKGHSAILE